MIIENILSSFSCIGGQYYYDINSKTPSFFVVGLLKSENKKNYELLVEAIRPFQKETKKLSNGLDISTYQFLEKQSLIQIVKFDNKVFFGTSDSAWAKNLEAPTSSFIKKTSLTSDIYWKFDFNTYFEKDISRSSENNQKEIKIILAPLGLKLLEKIKGEINIQKYNLSHKIEVPFKATDQKQVWDILSLKKISSSMIEQIPTDRKAFLCLNIDLPSSWRNFNIFMENYFEQIASNSEEGYNELKKEYNEKYEKTEDMCKVIFQMTISELATKGLTGELISWVAANPSPQQTIRLGIKDTEYANKIVDGLISIYSKDSGVIVKIIDKYINITLPVSKDLINQNWQKTNKEEKIAKSQSNLEIVNLKFYSWLDSSFSSNHSIKLLVFNLFSKGNRSKNVNLHSDLNLLNLLCSSMTNSESTFSNSKEKLSLELEGLDDFAQIIICNSLIDKKFINKKEIGLQYTEIKDKAGVNGKIVEYVSGKGHILNGFKTGRWLFYDYKGEIIGEGEFKNDQEIGFWKKTDFYGNKSEGEMLNGLQTGQWTIFDHFWKRPSIGEMKFGKKVGVWKSYHNKNKKLASEGEYIEDKKIGIWRFFHDNGLKLYEEKYNENGFLEGERMGWDAQGNIMSKEDYKNGQLRTLKYFKNQNLVREEEYDIENNSLQWSRTYYDSNLSLQREYRYDKVNAMEFFKEYTSNGQVTLSKQNIILMKEGKRLALKPIPTGEWQEWYENNTKKMVATFDKEGTGQKVFYYEYGNKCVEYQLEKGILSGAATGWYDNGNLFFTGNYQNGKLNGKWTIWYFDGKKKAEGEYKGGTISSTWKLWDKIGELKEDLILDSIEAVINKQKITEYENKIYGFAKELSYLKTFLDFSEILVQMNNFKNNNSIDSK